MDRQSRSQPGVHNVREAVAHTHAWHRARVGLHKRAPLMRLRVRRLRGLQGTEAQGTAGHRRPVVMA